MPSESLIITGKRTKVTTEKTAPFTRTVSVTSASDRSVSRDWPAGRVKPKATFIPPTSRSTSVTREDFPKGTMSVDLSNSTERYSGCLAGTSGFGWSSVSASGLGLASTDTLKAQSLTRALLNVKDMKVNLAQAFAERNQTASMISRTIRRLAYSLRALRKGDVAGAMMLLGSGLRRRLSTRDIADQWIEIQYGWRPLASDIYGAIRTLHRRDSDLKRYRMYARGSAKTSAVGTFTGFSGNAKRFVRTTHDWSVDTRLDYYRSSGWVSDLSSIGVLDPALLLWEVLPWSFLADWVLPIGSYLEARTAQLGLTFLGGSQSLRMITDSNAHFSPNPAASGVKSLHASGVKYVKSISRTVFDVAPTVPGPTFQDPFSWPHLANAIALLRQSFRR